MIHLLNISTCYILFLIISLASHASPCLTALEAEVSSVSTHHQELNPSPEFLEGVEFVERVIADIPNYQSQRTKRLSVWGEYKNQLRSRGVIPPFITIAKEIITSFIDEIKLRIPGRFNFSYNNTHRSNELFDLIIALEDALDGKDWKYVFALSNNVLTESIIKYLQEIHLSGARLFLTWEVLGLRAINRLFSHQTYPIGLVTGEVKNDGVTYNEFNFPLHDIFHAHEAFLMIESSLPSHEVSAEEKFTRTFYEQFNYDKIMNTLPERDKLLFDFGYFLYFHESIGNTEWGFQVSALLISQKITIKSLQRSYGQFFFRMEDFVYNFSSNNRVTVRYNRKKGSPEGFGPRNTISRLLNKDDMWDQLPIEIKKKINDSPDKAEEIAAGFAEEFFTLFFQIHYSLAVKILEIP